MRTSGYQSYDTSEVLRIESRAILLGARTHARRKKQLIVGLARQLAVDLWRWQTGQITPEKLGWAMQES